MTIKGVLFDFSGTLMHIEPAEHWLRAALERTGLTLPEGELARYAQELEEAGALPGGSTPAHLPPDLRELWEVRDRDARRHRELYTGLARRVALPDPALYDALYDRHKLPDAWEPYPDARAVLEELHLRGVPAAVVSNIGWDLRPVFRAHGLAPYVRDYVLSYELHVQKPEPEIFRAGCAALGLGPEQVLMVGDNARADGGATALGCAFHEVPPLRPQERPSALRPVLSLVP
ncbi:HAD family hydrolase [Streptomyces sp. ODS28]|uniref:HAD family hydrolase n=1 Tax=Streptomyces sp. ODS28 TaxID=3136688 RepID=UPI0031E4F47D